MRDYAELVKAMRYCSEHDNCGSRCPRFERNEDCVEQLTKDAADAIEELLAKVESSENRHVVESEMIDEMYAENERLKNKVPTWISVEERLPEDGKDVLCWYEYYHWNKEKMLPEYGIGYCINGHWGGEVSNGRDCKVLYWMPLPAPPKEDAECKN